MKQLLPKLACYFVFLLGLSACGGGSPSQDPKTGRSAGESTSGGISAGEPRGPTNTSPGAVAYPIAAAINSFLAQASSWTLEAQQDNNHYRLTTSFAPRSDDVEPNLSSSPLKSYLFTEGISVNGGPTEQSSSIVYYTSAPFRIWGERSETEAGEYAPAESAREWDTMPDSARLFDTGFLGVWPDVYYDESGYPVQSYQEVGWKLEEATTETAWLCIETQQELAQGPVAIDRCIRINQAGETLGYRVDLKASPVFLPFR